MVDLTQEDTGSCSTRLQMKAHDCSCVVFEPHPVCSVHHNSPNSRESLVAACRQAHSDSGASRTASLQQKHQRPDTKAAIQREVKARRAIIPMEDYLQTEEGAKQKRKTSARPDRHQTSRWMQVLSVTRTE